MAKDISKSVVLAILLIAVIVSVAGTWIVLESMGSVWTRGIVVKHALPGNVYLTIVGPPAQPSTAAMTGNAVLTIAK